MAILSLSRHREEVKRKMAVGKTRKRKKKPCVAWLLFYVLYPYQQLDHGIQKADNEQGGGLVVQIVHGTRSLSVFV